MGLLIDTSLLVDAERGVADVGELLGEEEMAISAITVSELLQGVLRGAGASRIRRRAFLEHLLANLEALPVTEAVARIHAEVSADLKQRGALIGTHDIWIASTALAHGHGVATANGSHFTRIPGLRVVAPR